MKIQRVDDKTVKCFLSKEELEEYQIDYKDFIMRNEKAKEVVQEIIQQAEEEVGYKPPRFAFDLQIMLLPDEGLLLTFSEREPEGAQFMECLKEMKKMLQQTKEKLGMTQEGEQNPFQTQEAAEDENVIDIEPKAEITYDDFAKLQFQVGEIIACEAVPKSKKLLCSQVKIGSQVKQIVSGIKAHYTPEEMVGKKVMVLVNLKPAKLAGVLSEGMLLCAEDAEGNLALVSPEKPMPAGAEIC